MGLFSAIGVGLGAFSAFSQGKAESDRARQDAANAKAEAALLETQALQRDTFAREELDRYLSSVTASRAANGLSAMSPGAIEFMKAATEQMGRDRLVERSNYRQQAANLRSGAGAARSASRLSLLTGVASAGSSIMQGFYS